MFFFAEILFRKFCFNMTLVPKYCIIISGTGNYEPFSLFGIRIEFLLFALVLTGIALFHHKTFQVALAGFAVILSYKLIIDPYFNAYEHFIGKEHSIFQQLTHKELREGEWVILLNLFGLLSGFALLAKIFQESGVPEILTKLLPSDWKAPFILLVFIMILSSFLDNIAAAMIGGAIAIVVFNNNVHIGYIAAIVAASNAGGAGSVLGDTTTTMMWIDGVSAMNVLHAFIASLAAFLFFGWFASHQQHKLQHIRHRFKERHHIDRKKISAVILILTGAVLGNILYDMPALGVWIALLICIFMVNVPWKEASKAMKGTLFLLCLVSSASLMPVETLPDASWKSTFFLGFVSAVFDNIPLTKLCLDQGHFDWGMLAYAVGFGGSMIWFGSSAGVAITNEFPEARNVLLWFKKGWHVTAAYVIGFFVLYLIIGWQPAGNKKHTEPALKCKTENCKVAAKTKHF